MTLVKNGKGAQRHPNSQPAYISLIYHSASIPWFNCWISLGNQPVAMPFTSRILTFITILTLPTFVGAQVDILNVGIFGVPEYDYSRDLISTTDGNLIMVSYHSTPQFSASHSMIRKLSPDMDLLWETKLGEDERTFLRGVTETDDGGYLCIGATEEDLWGDTESYDVLVVKLDSDGNLLWSHTHGGEWTDHGRSVLPTSDGGYIFLSDSNSFEVDGQPREDREDFNIWLSKIDASGNEVWSTFYDTGESELSRKIIPSKNGSFLLCGLSRTPTDVIPYLDNEALVLQFSESGEIEWETTFGGSDKELLFNIAQDEDGHIYVTGYTGSSDIDINENKGGNDWLIAKLQETGELVWTKTIGSSRTESAQDLIFTENGKLLITGENAIGDGDFTTNQGRLDVSIALLDKEGTVFWIESLGGSSNDLPLRLTVINERTYLYGISASTDGDIITDIGEDDLFLLELNVIDSVLSNNTIQLQAREHENGNINLRWLHHMDTETHLTTLERSCDLNKWDEILTLRYDSEIKEFTDNFSCKGANYYRLKLEDINNKYYYSDIATVTLDLSGIEIMPNPVSSGENVFIHNPEKDAIKIQLLNVEGRTLLEQKSSDNLNLTTGNLPKGYYQILLTTENGQTSTHKLIIN